ncbi:DNA repair protein RecO [Patescibacteria group bacterium]
MFVHYKTPCLILKKKNRNEADQLFTVYTKEFGKLEVLGRAIRKIASKLRAGMEVFSISEIEFIQGKAFKILTDAILIEKFENLNKNLKTLKIANKISTVVDDLIKGQEFDENIWNLLVKTFQRLDRCHSFTNICLFIYYYFLWNFFSLLGYQPEIYECSLCQKKIKPEKNYFSAKDGGIVCLNCGKSVKNAKEINLETIKILRIIIKKDWKTLSKIKLKPEQMKSLESVSQNYLCRISETTG